MEPAASSGSVYPVYNDLDLKVEAYDGSSSSILYPNNLAERDPHNTVEVVTISDVDQYEWLNVSGLFRGGGRHGGEVGRGEGARQSACGGCR